VLGDYPNSSKSKPAPGNEPLRKTVSVRVRGKTARFLNLLEPYEDKPLVTSATASGPDQLHVTLADGRVQDIHITDLCGNGKSLTATITESEDGKVLRTETTSSAP
jgi:hypothetical protein